MLTPVSSQAFFGKPEVAVWRRDGIGFKKRWETDGDDELLIHSADPDACADCWYLVQAPPHAEGLLGASWM